MRIGITFGTFDLFHIGHVNILRRARSLCDYLVVGVSSDALNVKKKGEGPIFSETERIAIVASSRYVDRVFVEESLELKLQYIAEHEADVLIMGDDWRGKFDFCLPHCEVVYLPRTESISTSHLKQRLAVSAGSCPEKAIG